MADIAICPYCGFKVRIHRNGTMVKHSDSSRPIMHVCRGSGEKA